LSCREGHLNSDTPLNRIKIFFNPLFHGICQTPCLASTHLLAPEKAKVLTSLDDLPRPTRPTMITPICSCLGTT
jgi:hypothetical protein